MSKNYQITMTLLADCDILIELDTNDYKRARIVRDWPEAIKAVADCVSIEIDVL